MRTIDRSLNGCFGPHRMWLRRQIDGWRSRKRYFFQGVFGQLNVCGFLVLGNFVQTITVCCDPVVKKMFLVLLGHGAFQSEILTSSLQGVANPDLLINLLAKNCTDKHADSVVKFC